MPEQQQDGVFELGLVMAGAVSAGAYTAGVVDFLIEALAAWEQEKHVHPEAVLGHTTRIAVLAGASAGGMTSAVLATALGHAIEPVTDLQLGVTPKQQNPLYTSWVESVDAASLLRTDDLGTGKIASLLCCSVLDTVANTYMLPQGHPAALPPYIAAGLDVFLTLANLDGIPYRIPFRGAGGYGHQMILHKDYAHFVRFQGQKPAYNKPMNDSPHFLDAGDPASKEWAYFKTAALATGAFPLALAPRLLERTIDEYCHRKWLVPQHVQYNPQTSGITIEADEQEIALDRSLLPETRDLKENTLNVDGGTFDNDPLELARRCLAGPELVNPREPGRVNRAVVLIDPFPQKAAIPQESATATPDLLTMASRILGAMKDNARFKPQELTLAQDPDCYSRFLIGPVREGAPAGQSPIACGCLGGFSGFLSRLFRQHDFQLGRRNCQAFLWKHFTIPLASARSNPVFKPNAANLEKFAYPVDKPDGGQEMVVPLIPLVPAVHPRHGGEVKPLPWSGLVFSENDLQALRRPIINRTKKLGSILLGNYVKDCLAKLVAGCVASSQYPKLADWVLGKVRADLRQNGLMPY